MCLESAVGKRAHTRFCPRSARVNVGYFKCRVVALRSTLGARDRKHHDCCESPLHSTSSRPNVVSCR